MCFLRSLFAVIWVWPWLWTGWIGCRCDAHRKQVGVKQWYNPVREEVQLVGVSLLQFEEVRTRPSRELGPRGPRLNSPAERGRNAAKDKGTGGQYVAVFVQSPTHLSHITLSQPFGIKWEVYFSEEVCSPVIIVLTMFPRVLYFDLLTQPKMPFQGDAMEGGDTF